MLLCLLKDVNLYLSSTKIKFELMKFFKILKGEVVRSFFYPFDQREVLKGEPSKKMKACQCNYLFFFSIYYYEFEFFSKFCNFSNNSEKIQKKLENLKLFRNSHFTCMIINNVHVHSMMWIFYTFFFLLIIKSHQSDFVDVSLCN